MESISKLRHKRNGLNAAIKAPKKLDFYYQIKLTVAVFKETKLVYRNELIVPAKYRSKFEAQKQIQAELEKRLRYSYFFLSPRPEFDIVKYADMASCNTYLKFRVIENLGSHAGLPQSKPNHAAG